MNIMITMPGIAISSTVILLGEFGPFKDFSSRNETGAFVASTQCGKTPVQAFESHI